MAKYSLAFKREVVDAYLDPDQGDGIKRLAKRYGVPRNHVRHWVALFKEHGEAGLSRRRRQTYSPELKLEILQRMVREELSYTQVTALYGIRNKSSVAAWERQYNEGGIEALRPRPKGRQPAMPKPEPPPVPPLPAPDRNATHEQLLKENAYLRAEVAYLKKLDALVQAKSTTPPTKRG